MSEIPSTVWDSEAAVVEKLISAGQSPHTVVATENSEGRVTFREHGLVGEPSVFRNQCFEIVELAETLTIDKRARVYEELVLRKEMTDRVERVFAILSREQAEITVAGDSVGETWSGPSQQARS